MPNADVKTKKATYYHATEHWFGKEAEVIVERQFTGGLPSYNNGLYVSKSPKKRFGLHVYEVSADVEPTWEEELYPWDTEEQQNDNYYFTAGTKVRLHIVTEVLNA